MNGDFHGRRILMALTSLLLMLGVALAAVRIVPRLPGSVIKPDVSYAMLGKINANTGEGPVFILGNDLFPQQCGKGYLTNSGKLNLLAYQNPSCQAGITQLQPYLLAADIRVPWSVFPSKERDELRRLAGTVIRQWESVGDQLIHSQFFQQYYSPEIKEILRDSFRSAWVSSAVENALNRASETFDRRQIDQIIEGIVPIVFEKAKKNFWQTLRGYTESLISGEDKSHQENMAKLGAEVFADPRTREHIAQTFPVLLTSREVMIVSAIMAKESFKAIINNPRSLPLVGKLLTDQRFLALQPFSTEVENFIRILPSRLMRLRRRFDHNPLATYILRNMIRGRRGFLIIMLSPNQELQLANSDLPPGPALRRIDP